MLRLSGDPAREPPDERTEYQPGLGREGNVGGHADEGAEQQPDHRADNDEEPQSPGVFRASDTYTDHPPRKHPPQAV